MRKLLLLTALWPCFALLAHAATFRNYHGYEILSQSGTTTTLRLWLSSDPTSSENLVGQLQWINGGNVLNSSWLIATSGSTAAYPDANYYLDFTIPSSSTDIGIVLANCNAGSTTNNCYGHTAYSVAAGPLPVELLHFTARKEDKSVFLQWATAAERDNRGFEVERSSDGVHWTFYAWVSSVNSNTTRQQEYALLDEHPLRGLNYYRLRQIDRNGKTIVYPSVSVNMGGHNHFQIINNPVQQGELMLFLSETDSGNATVRLFNAVGQLARSWQLEATADQTLPLDVSGLTGGVWFLQVEQSPAVRVVLLQ